MTTAVAAPERVDANRHVENTALLNQHRDFSANNALNHPEGNAGYHAAVARNDMYAGDVVAKNGFPAANDVISGLDKPGHGHQGGDPTVAAATETAEAQKRIEHTTEIANSQIAVGERNLGKDETTFGTDTTNFANLQTTTYGSKTFDAAEPGRPSYQANAGAEIPPQTRTDLG
jgi:hypothetical protein